VTDLLDRLDAEIATVEARLAKLRAARETLVELNGFLPAVPVRAPEPPAPSPPAEAPPGKPTPPARAASGAQTRLDRQREVARFLAANGPSSAGAILAACQLPSHHWTGASGLNKSPWYEARGIKAGTRYQLTDAGRKELARSTLVGA
jgi:hypothetical protein